MLVDFFFFSQSKTCNFMENAIMAILAQTNDTPSEDIVKASKSVFLTAANIVETLKTIQSEGNKVRVHF